MQQASQQVPGMQRSGKVMKSTKQTPQGASSASQPRQMTNEPQQMQHGRTKERHRRKKNKAVSQNMQEMSSGTSPGSEDLQTTPHKAPDAPSMPLQSLRPIHGPQKTSKNMQKKLQQLHPSHQKLQMSPHQKQQLKTEKQHMQQAKFMHQIREVDIGSKKSHVSHGKPAPPPVMPSPQKVLERTPVAQHVSENHQTRDIANSKLQKKQMKTQQHKKQQDMTVLTSLPVPQQTLHVFTIQNKALQSTPAPQKAQDEMNVSQKNPQTTPQSQLSPQETATSQTSLPQVSQERIMALLEELEFSLVLELVSLTPMIGPKPPSKWSFDSNTSRRDDIQKINYDIQNQLAHDKTVNKPYCGAIKRNQVQPSEILSDFHKNLMTAVLADEIDEETKHYFDLDCKSTLFLAKDFLVTLQNLEQCDLETMKSDSETSSVTEMKENSNVKNLRNEKYASGMKKPSKMGSYCRLRHILLQARHLKQSVDHHESSAKIIFTFSTNEGVDMTWGPIINHLPAKRFLERMSMQKYSGEGITDTERIELYYEFFNSFHKPVEEGKFNEAEIMMTPVLEVVRYLSKQANLKAVKAHNYVFSALLQELHLKNQVISGYFKYIAEVCLRNSEVQIEDKPVRVTNSQAQRDIGNEIISSQDGGKCNINTVEVLSEKFSTDELSGFRGELSQNTPVGLDNSQSHEQNLSNSEFLKGVPGSPYTPAPDALLPAILKFCLVSQFKWSRLIERFHIRMVLKSMCVILNASGPLSIKNSSGTSIPTVSQTHQERKTQLLNRIIGKSYFKHLIQKSESSNTAENQQKNLKHCYVTYKNQSPVTSAGESNNNVGPSSHVSNPMRVPPLSIQRRLVKESEQEDMQQTMSFSTQQKCDDSVKNSSLASEDTIKENLKIRELCNILSAGENCILTCRGCDPSSNKAYNPEMIHTSERETCGKSYVSSEESVCEVRHVNTKPGDLLLLMPLDEKFFIIWKMAIDSHNMKTAGTRHYEAGKDGFIKYMRTPEAAQHGNRSQSSTEHSKPGSNETHQQATSARITTNIVPTCSCSTCTGKFNEGLKSSISGAAMVIDYFEILMKAFSVGAILQARRCKKEHATDMIQETKDTRSDDTEKDNNKKTVQGKP